MLHVAQHPNNKIECFKIMKNVAQNKKHEVVGLEDWKDKRAKLGTWSHAVLTLLLLVRATYWQVLLLAHTPFVVHHACDARQPSLQKHAILKQTNVF